MNSLIKKEYFDLINKLNQSNKLKNQASDVYFYINKTDLFGEKFFAAISSNQKILLIEKNFNGSWRPANLSGFFELEDFLATLLNLPECEENLTDFIKSHIFKLD